MKILLLTDRFPPEVRSSAHLFHALAREFQARGHEVGVITKVPSKYIPSGGPNDGKKTLDAWQRFDGIPVRRVRGFPFLNGHPSARAADHLSLWLTFAFAAREWPKADVLLIYSPPLPLAFAGGVYRRFFRAPFVLNVQDLYPQTAIDLGLLRNRAAIRVAESLESVAYHWADRIVVHSPGNQEYLTGRKGVPKNKVRVIYNWIDPELLEPRPKANDFRKRHGLDSHFVVSFAGVMGYAQDLTTTIECAERLRDRQDIVFLLVGEGVAENRWKAMATEKRLGNVRFLPMQPPEVYAQLLAASDVCLVALTNDLKTPVVPGKLQSIMASGRPLIATVNLEGDTGKIIDAARCGFALEPGDPRALAALVLRLCAEPRWADELGENGRTYAREHFSLGGCCSAYEELFSEVVGRARAGPPDE